MARVTVWFDGNCPLCRREISLMTRLDSGKRIRFVDVHNAKQLPLDQDLLLGRFHAQEQDSPIVSGAAAFAAMWRAIPWLAPFGYLAKLPPVLWILEKLYLRFLKIRPRLQTWFGGEPGECPAPNTSKNS